MATATKKNAAQKYCETVDTLAAALEKTPSELYRYWGRGAPKRRTKRGYSVEPLRKWIEKNVRAKKKKPPSSDEQILKKLEISIKYWERLYKKEKAKASRLQRERAEGRVVPREEYENLGLGLIQIFNRAMDDLVRSIPGLPAKQRKLLEERLQDVRMRLADEVERGNW